VHRLPRVKALRCVLLAVARSRQRRLRANIGRVSPRTPVGADLPLHAKHPSGYHMAQTTCLTSGIDQRPHVEFGHHVWPATPCQLAAIQSEIWRWLMPLHLTATCAGGLLSAAGEAANNAMKHAYRPSTVHDTVELTFWTESSVVCIEIIDHGKWRMPPVDLTGQGIPMMRRQVDSVAIHFDRRGTRVLLRHQF
jgi:anti-sigma regulatory factor (Ser/Thr protein kinase)